MHHRLIMLSAVALWSTGGCQRLPGGDDGTDQSPPPETTSGGTLLPGVDEGDQVDADSGDAESFCDPVVQSGCSAEEKCTAITSGSQVIYACVSDAGPLDPGSPCEASLGDGIDGCPAGFVCLASDIGNGLCVSLCTTGSDCEQAECVPSREDRVPYCADDCLPFGSQCSAPLQCRRNGIRFSCLFIGESDNGIAGDACGIMQDAGCAPGLVCIPGALVPDCSSDNCCTTLCDVTETSVCVSPANCVPLLPNPAPGFEDIGACFVPA